MKHHHNWTSEDEVVLAREYPEHGPHKIMELLGLTYHQVTNRARKLGLKYRNLGKAANAWRKTAEPFCDVTYFRRWSPNSAYLLGYIWADGCVRVSPKSSCVALQAKLEDVTELFDQIRAELKCRRAKVRFTVPSGYSRNTHARLAICSYQLVDDLINLHGIIPAKTYHDVPFPSHIPDDLNCHFVRGYFDGDGIQSYTERKDRPTPTLAVGFCGQPLFISQLAKLLSAILSIRLPQVQVRQATYARFQCRAIDAVRKLYSWMYPPTDVPYLFMKRRRDWFLRHLSPQPVHN